MKQRLWGAAVLIALAVIFLPMLVKGPAPDSGVSDVPLDSPKAPDATVKTQELPLDVPGAIGKGGATGMPAAQVNADSAANVTSSAAAPAQSGTAATTDAKPSVTMAAGDYAVSFGSYGSSSDADRVVQALTAIKLHGYGEKVSLSGRDAWRVRIGPYPTREAAEVARVQAVQLNPQVKAQVIALDANATQAPAQTASTSTAQAATPAIATTPIASSKPVDKPVETPAPAAPKPKPAVPTAKPDKATAAATPAKPVQPTETRPEVAEQDAPAAPKPEPKPADKPAASGTGFAVQLGAFANTAEATALRDRARAAGFSATTDTVKTDKGVLTRVRLGPVVGRDAANALKTRAQTTLGVSGIVRPSP